jgi:hypothetical protein
MRGRLVALLSLAVLVLSPALAECVPGDPTWIHGLWDAADGDELVAAATSLEALADLDLPDASTPVRPLLGSIVHVPPRPPESISGRQPSIRAPPSA